ncbi:hypothetical protein [Acinetobacter pittii]|uniref:hypothetical protein n=1 Tax=Acinetobacter pittii TaxID=48296 RepID=UPI001ABFC0B8|nr:hypothetical protein [Acinetobacter pittii]QDB82219.1 hypothetical protein APMS7_07445 [Acinetobacter pittii]
MQSNKQILLSVLFWGVVAYALALLTYCSFRNFYNTTADFISAFASILGACAAFFAAFVAAYLFTGWKVQHNKQITNEFAIKAYTNFSKFEESVFKLQSIFEELTDCIDFIDPEPLSLESPIVKAKSGEISLFFNQLKVCKYHYELFLSQLVDYSIMSNQEVSFQPIVQNLQQALGETFLDPDNHSYGNFNDLFYKHAPIVEEYFRLGKSTRALIINKLLKILQE